MDGDGSRIRQAQTVAALAGSCALLSLRLQHSPSPFPFSLPSIKPTLQKTLSHVFSSPSPSRLVFDFASPSASARSTTAHAPTLRQATPLSARSTPRLTYQPHQETSHLRFANSLESLSSIITSSPHVDFHPGFLLSYGSQLFALKHP